MVKKAEDYQWSSASAHCGKKTDLLLTGFPDQQRAVTEHDWSGWLSIPEDRESVKILRRNVDKGLPCGSNEFIDKLEKLFDGNLRYNPQGRPETEKG